MIFQVDPDEARDGVQEAFIKAWQALPRFDVKRRFGPWFFQILRNHCRDMIRGRELSPADGERLARSIDRYRNDKTTPLTNENATSISPQPTSGPAGK